ncbi:MAG: periplasmic heavy metal sensor [Ignavibacteriales bacterium]|nr:periplasmic heavy metal sensor [Ignavibacteriales bacterium]
MKRLMMTLIVLMLVVLVSALAQQDQKKEAPAPKVVKGVPLEMKHGHMQGEMGGMMGGMMGGAQGGPMAFLKLTEEQRTKVQDLALAHQKEMIAARADLQKQHASLKLEVTADKFNESKVKSIQGEISKLSSEIAMKTFLHQRAVRDLLTPDQKKQFDRHVLAGGMMGGRGPMGPGGMMKQGGMKGQGGMMGRGGMTGRGGMMGRGVMMGGKGMGPGGMMHQGAMNGSMDCDQCKGKK